MQATANETSRMGKARGQIKNTGDPRGQFAAFLRDWIDRKHDGESAKAAQALGISVRLLNYWAAGVKSPQLDNLDRVAQVMGYPDWSKLASAVVRHKN